MLTCSASLPSQLKGAVWVCGLQTLSIIATWPTKVDVCLITDDEVALQNVLDRWARPGVQICKFSTPIPEEEEWTYEGKTINIQAWNLLVRIIPRLTRSKRCAVLT